MAKHSRALGCIRELCALNLPTAMLVPQLIPLMRTLVPFTEYAIAWFDRECNMTNSMVSLTDPFVLDYLANHFDQLEKDAGVTTQEVMRFAPAVACMQASDIPGYVNSMTYAKLWRPANIESNLIIVLRNAREEPLGQFQLFRPASEPAFSQDEMKAMQAALPYLRKAFEKEGPHPQSLVDGPGSGLLVLDEQGEVLFFSSEARSLCVQAFNPRSKVEGSPPRWLGSDMDQGLSTLFAEVQAAHGDDDPANAVARVVVRENGWGAFRFTSHLLDAPQGGRRAYGISVRHALPKELWLARAVQDLGLTARQREVAVRLTGLAEMDSIARDLGVSRETLRDHSRAVYARVGVANRNQLRDRLLPRDPAVSGAA